MAVIDLAREEIIEAEALRIWNETYVDEPPEFFRSTVWHFYLDEARRTLGVSA